MALYYLMNTVRIGTRKYLPGKAFDDASSTDIGAVTALGGILRPASDPGVAAAAALAEKYRQKGAAEEVLESVMRSATSGGAIQVLHEGVALGTFERLNFTGTGVASAVVDPDAGQGDLAFTVGGSGNEQVDSFSATNAQTDFVLSFAPLVSGNVEVTVNGLEYPISAGHWAFVSPRTVRWQNTPFSMEAGDVVEARYQH